MDDLLASFQTDPTLVARYGNQLRGMAEQGIVSFRDILLGALQFDAPSILDHELDWLDRLLQARQVEGNKVGLFLTTFAHRLETDLPPQDNAPLLALIHQAQSHTNG